MNGKMRLVRGFRISSTVLSWRQKHHSYKQQIMKGNQVILVGYVGQNLKTGKSADGTKRVAIRMATHVQVKEKQGKMQTNTMWYDVVAWDRTGLFAERNFVKGSRILVEGSIVYRTYADNTGHIRYITQINAHSLMNLDR